MSDERIAKARAFCRKFDIKTQTSPSLPAQPELRALLLGIANTTLNLLTASFGRAQGLDMVQSELREIVQLDKLDFNMVETVVALAQLDEATEVFRLVLGVEGAAIADEVHRAAVQEEPVRTEHIQRVLRGQSQE